MPTTEIYTKRIQVSELGKGEIIVLRNGRGGTIEREVLEVETLPDGRKKIYYEKTFETVPAASEVLVAR